jgi:uncharacterized membrane protein
LENLFLGVAGLPLHPLVVHFAVALFPLALIWLIVVAANQKFRNRHLAKAIIGVALTIPFIALSQQSGEALSEVLYKPDPHSEYGEMLMPLALSTLALAFVFWWLLNRGPKFLSQILGFALISLSVASIAMTVVVGHSGASATWTGVLP